MSNLSADIVAGPQLDRRLGRRRTIKKQIRVALRRGPTALGPNLAIALIDVSRDGLGVHLAVSLDFGDEVRIELASPEVGKPLELVGAVRWCMAVGDGTFRAGVHLRGQLADSDLTSLTE